MARVRRTRGGNFNVVHETTGKRLAGPFQSRSKANSRRDEIIKDNIPRSRRPDRLR